MSRIRLFVTAMMAMAFVTGCASSAQKARKEQRDKLVQSSKLYCEFINGEQNADIDVALNLQVAQKCDYQHPLSMTSYKTPSEISGIMYCCVASAGAVSSEKSGEKSGEKSSGASAKTDTGSAAAGVGKTTDKKSGSAPGGKDSKSNEPELE